METDGQDPHVSNDNTRRGLATGLEDAERVTDWIGDGATVFGY
jgi:hypothetical protein